MHAFPPYNNQQQRINKLPRPLSPPLFCARRTENTSSGKPTPKEGDVGNAMQMQSACCGLEYSHLPGSQRRPHWENVCLEFINTSWIHSLKICSSLLGTIQRWHHMRHLQLKDHLVYFPEFFSELLRSRLQPLRNFPPPWGSHQSGQANHPLKMHASFAPWFLISSLGSKCLKKAARICLRKSGLRPGEFVPEEDVTCLPFLLSSADPRREQSCMDSA